MLKAFAPKKYGMKAPRKMEKVILHEHVFAPSLPLVGKLIYLYSVRVADISSSRRVVNEETLYVWNMTNCMFLVIKFFIGLFILVPNIAL